VRKRSLIKKLESDLNDLERLREERQIVIDALLEIRQLTRYRVHIVNDVRHRLNQTLYRLGAIGTDEL